MTGVSDVERASRHVIPSQRGLIRVSAMTEHSAPGRCEARSATGLQCPLPVLKGGGALRDVPAGGILEVVATDPGAVQEFRPFLPCDRPASCSNRAKPAAY